MKGQRAEVYQRTQCGETGRVGCDYSNTVELAGLETGYLDRCIAATKLSHCNNSLSLPDSCVCMAQGQTFYAVYMDGVSKGGVLAFRRLPVKEDTLSGNASE